MSATVDTMPPNNVSITRAAIDSNSYRRCAGTFADHSLIMTAHLLFTNLCCKLHYAIITENIVFKQKK